MKLLKELNEEAEPLIEEVLSESGVATKNYWIKGPYIQMEQKNRNGRFYPKGNVGPVVEDYIANMVSKNAAYGELGHPDSPKIEPMNISHLIKTLTLEGNDYIGKAIVLNSPKGNVIKAIIDVGGRIGTSTRGLGSLREENGMKVVQNDFTLSTAGDCVLDPSGPNCFLEAIMEESEWLFDGKNWRKAEAIKEEVKRTPKKRLNEALFHNLLNKYLKGIE